ncbi:MAG TPA: hypothetical protein VNE00_00875 [Paraburkholderia sp.]|jgi:hypothetical protein|nr:hypothetical protein [Paraburkholderia sp.]
MKTVDPDKKAKAQFDEAIMRLDAAQQRLDALFDNPLADDESRAAAQSAYDEARLLWLSSEAVLRSAAVNHPRPSPRNVLILRGNAHIAESIALLLRLRGYGVTVVSKHRLDEPVPHAPAAAIIVDIEREQDREWLGSIEKLRTTAATRIVAMIPAALQRRNWQGFDSVLVKPASIDMLVQCMNLSADSNPDAADNQPGSRAS